MKQITLKWKKYVSKLNLIKRKIYLESNLYKIKALFWKKIWGSPKTGQNVTLVLHKKHFEIKPRLTAGNLSLDIEV